MHPDAQRVGEGDPSPTRAGQLVSISACQLLFAEVLTSPRTLQHAVHGLEGVPAEEMVCGGQSREGCALDLWLSEGVATEDQRLVIGGDEAWFRVGLCNPAVAPAGEGGLENGGCEVGAETVARERDHGAYDLRLVVFEVRAAPFRSGVDRDGRGF